MTEPTDLKSSWCHRCRLADGRDTEDLAFDDRIFAHMTEQRITALPQSLVQ